MLRLEMSEPPGMFTSKASIIEVGIAPTNQLMIAKLVAAAGLGERLRDFDWDRDLNWIYGSDGRATFSANELSGGLRYRLRPLEEEPGNDVSASPASLEQIARAFLDKLRRPTDPIALEAVTYLRTESGTSEGEVTGRATLDAGLIFRRTVDELPVFGPGGIAMIKIGTDETVVGGREVCRPIVRRGAPVSLRPPDEAASLLRSRLQRLGLDGEIRVSSASLGYAELGIEREQRYLEPCYAYVFAVAGEFVEAKQIAVIPAARTGPMAEAFASAF